MTTTGTPLGELRSLVRDFLPTSPYPLLFLSLAGSRGYGFAGPESDYDLRGVHVIPRRVALGLSPGRSAVDSRFTLDGRLSCEMGTWDIQKLIGLLLSHNARAHELVCAFDRVYEAHKDHFVVDSLREMGALARVSLTDDVALAYDGMAHELFARAMAAQTQPLKVKLLLHTYRALLTGIHALRQGEIIVWYPALVEEHLATSVDGDGALLDLLFLRHQEAQPLDDARYQAIFAGLRDTLRTEFTRPHTLPRFLPLGIYGQWNDWLLGLRDSYSV